MAGAFAGGGATAAEAVVRVVAVRGRLAGVAVDAVPAADVAGVSVSAGGRAMGDVVDVGVAGVGVRVAERPVSA